ncbi:MAG: thiamine-phosphate kinase [Pirellulaceae bacterium]|nr:thiamine-phosphate kinase [Pirellulaceae bacterium]
MEQSFVAWAKMRARRLPQVKLGIGDDAAILQGSTDDWVVTTDTLMDGVHFISSEVSAERIGRKLVSVNLSDLAAMAAEPVAVFLNLCLPRSASQQVAADIYEGVCQVAERYQIALAGGDTNCWDGPLVLGLTAIGRTVDGLAWVRSGAQPGDAIVVTGPLGGSILGKHLDFEPRIELARLIRDKIAIHAAMDISDGLSTDLLRMCDASHCGAVLDLADIPVTEQAQQLATTSGKTAVEHALGDGEDFELLLAVAESDLQKLTELIGQSQCHRVGTFTSRTGLWAREGSRIRQLPVTGYVHQ